jgi:hypothetical protein
MMSLEPLESKLAEMEITKTRTPALAPILEPPIIQEIFANDMDVYSADRETRHCILEVPNTYCGRYYDDEDFIYTKMRLSNTPENMESMDGIDGASGIDYLAYMMEHNLIISNAELDLNPQSVMAKVLYIYQHTKSYYTSLGHLRPRDRLNAIPSDLLVWISNTTDTIRILLDKDLFNYSSNGRNENIPLEMFQEMVYGLGLITCHIRLICNHYKSKGLGFQDLEEKHLKKIMRLVNNLCVIMIYFWKML